MNTRDTAADDDLEDADETRVSAGPFEAAVKLCRVLLFVGRDRGETLGLRQFLTTCRPRLCISSVHFRRRHYQTATDFGRYAHQQLRRLVVDGERNRRSQRHPAFDTSVRAGAVLSSLFAHR